MSVIEFFSQPLWHRLGMTLTHFVWQGLVVTILASAVVRLFRLRAGNARYCAYFLAFMVVAICPVITFIMIETSAEPLVKTSVISAEPRADSGAFSPPLRPFSEASSEREISVKKQSPLEAVRSSVPLQQRVYSALESLLPWAIASWIIGVVLLSGRLLLGFVGVCRWRRNLKPLPENLAQRVALLGERLGMRGFSAVFISPSALQAMAVGYLRPLVLLPVSMVTQMQPEMLEAVIAHELAHIRRFDLWVNLAQRVIETLLFYHPAVWWLSSQLRSEREFCCDELAIAATGERLAYASALESAGRARFEAQESALSLAFGQRRNSTLGRVRHVLGLPPAPPDSRFWLAGLIAVVVLVVLVMPVTSALIARAEAKVGGQSLHEAVAAGSIERVKSLLSEGTDVNERDKIGCTPLHYTAQKGNWVMTQLLLANGADVHAKDPSGDTPLHYAARQGQPEHIDIIRMLVKAGADVNARNAQGQTAGHVAVENSIQTVMHSTTFETLVRRGLNVDAKDNNGNTVLHLIPQYSNIYLGGLGALIGASTNLTLPDAKGQTPLHIAIRHGHNNMIRKLVERAQAHDLNTPDPYQVTPLHIAAACGDTHLVDTLLSKGANINVKDIHGQTPTHFAIRAAHQPVADLMINRGCDASSVWLTAYQGDLPQLKKLTKAEFSVHVKDEGGFSLLHAAALGGHDDVIKYLLSEGADIQAQTQVGWTALSYAAVGNHMEIVKNLQTKGVNGGTGVSKLLPIVAEQGYVKAVETLIDLGADVNTEDGGPLQKAARLGHKEVVELLIARGADVNLGGKIPFRHAENLGGKAPLHQAIRGNQIDIAEGLIAAGADVNGGEWTPLHEAAKSVNLKMVSLLLSRGADVDKPREWTPLDQLIDMETFDTDAQEIAKLLISHGADPSGKPLFIAAWYYTPFVPLLLNAGADVHARDPRGWTALHFTVLYDNRDVCEQLLAKGADVNAQTDAGQTLLHLSIDHNVTVDQVEFVLNKGVDIDVKDKRGCTALHHAVLFGRLDIVTLLVQRGANVSAKDNQDQTPLSYAQNTGKTEIVELLRKHGAKD